MRKIRFRGKGLYEGSDKEEWAFGKLRDSFTIMDLRDREYSVDPETVGQYIGLKDKNGEDIYEGDVLKFSWMRGFHLVESFHVVRFCENAAAFRFWDGQTWSPFWGFSDEDMEVVGNIFDDPEFNERFGTPYREL